MADTGKRSESRVQYKEDNPNEKKGQGLRSFILFVLVAAIMGSCLVQYYRLRSEQASLEQTKAELEQSIEDEKAKQLQTKIDQSYYESDRYKEEMARNRFNLLYPGEILIELEE